MRAPRKDDLIQIRVEGTDKRRLVETARRRGLTLSALMRDVISDAAKRVAV